MTTGPQRPDVPARAYALLVETHRTHRPAEQAELLGVTVTTIQVYRNALYRAGVLDKAARASQRPVAPNEPERAAQLARQGAALREIAGSLRRTEADISEMLAPFGGLRHLRAQGGADTWYSGEEAAALLGVGRSTMRRWCREGIIAADRTKDDLPKTRGRKRSRGGPVAGFYRISRGAVADFLRDRTHWMEYAASGICDADLRRLSETLRAEAGGRWVKLRTFDGAASTTTYAHWRAAGWPGPDWEVVRSGTTDWLWLPARTAPPATPRRRGER
jgi:transposase